MSRYTRFAPTSGPWFWLGALLAAWLIGCGGGGGDQSAGVGVGGTGGSGGTGPITGLGSIIVNDVRFDDSVGAKDEDNASASTALGMQVEVVGGPTRTDGDGFTAATASSVRVIRGIQGPVQGNVQTSDNVAGTVVVLGQTVETDASTLYQDLPFGLASLSNGTVVTVYGFYDSARARFLATRVEAVSGLSAYVVRAKVTAVPSALGGNTFTLGSLVVDASTLSTLPVVGDVVRVKLATRADGQGRWLASSQTVVASPGWANGTALKVEGLVSDYGGLSSFKVNGQAVNATGQVSFNNGSSSGVADGSRVEVEGVVSAGTLVASKLSFKSSGGSTKLIGPISGTNITTNHSFTLKGLTVNYNPTTTRFDDGSEANLIPQRQVEAEGTLSADGTVLTATRIRLR